MNFACYFATFRAVCTECNMRCVIHVRWKIFARMQNVCKMYIYYPFVFNLCEETISRTDEGQPRPKYIFNKCGTNISFFTLQRFGPSPSPNFKLSIDIDIYIT